MKRKILSLILALTLTCTLSIGTAFAAAEQTTTQSTNEQSTTQASSSIEGGAILHTWCWSFKTIEDNMKSIADAGYAAVQTSPISECLVGENGGMQLMGNGKWYYHYQPISYKIGNYQLGTADDFEQMCTVAKSYGVKVIVDGVINHMTSKSASISQDITSLPGGAFHENGGIDNYNNRRENTQNNLLGLKDLNTQNPAVQQMIKTYLEECVALGADGFRFDAAGHIEVPEDPAEFRSNFWPVVLDNGAEFQYGENLNDHYQSLYPKYMNIVAPSYGISIRLAVRTGRLTAATMSDYKAPGISPSQLITWVESHDNYTGDNSWEDLSGEQVKLGWAIIGARKSSTNLFFSRPQGSSTTDQWGENKIGIAGNDDYKSKEVIEINFFKQAMKNEDERMSNLEKNLSVLLIERGTKGAVIVNGSKETQFVNAMPTSLPNGTYTDRISERKFHVINGALYGELDSISFAVLYSDERSEQLQLKMGDIDLNGGVEIDDVLLAQKQVAKLIELKNLQFITADVNKDGAIDLTDVLMLQKKVAALIDLD